MKLRIFLLILPAFFLINCSSPDSKKISVIKWGKQTDSILHDTVHVRKIIDSLKREILRAPNDTFAINRVNELAERCSGKSALILSDEALAQSRKLNYKFGEADAFCRKGFYFFVCDKYDSARFYLNKCLDIAQKENFTVLKIQAHTTLGNVCRYQFDSLGADTNIKRALAFSKSINEHRRRGMCYNMLGESALFYGQTETGRKYLDSAAVEAEMSGEKATDSYALLILGSLYVQEGDYTTAMEKFSRSLAVGLEAEDNVRIASAYGSIGEIYFSQKIMDKAMDNLNRSVHYS
ncbi:MAG TPA: hypothetical protein VFJ43_06565, partial [Bacteroidia bacterium]|nr:hypothetical protein [Bacteroidia bacterium]